MKELRVVCPVYNESAPCLRALVAEWEPVLLRHLTDWEWVFIDDGSTRPETTSALEEIARSRPCFRRLRIPNSGHGGACLHGYRTFCRDSRWLLQVDSDGQCRAEDFPTLWAARAEGWHQFGVRRAREDGWSRRLISQGIRIYLGLVTGGWHPDPNCPFRLLWCRHLEPHLAGMPFALVNIALALRLKDQSRFSPIGFHRRHDHRSSVRVLPALRALAEFARFPTQAMPRHLGDQSRGGPS